jgi:hypothetical protein
MNADPKLEAARRVYDETCCESLLMLEAEEERRERATWSWVCELGWSFAAVDSGERAGNGSVFSGADIVAICGICG